MKVGDEVRWNGVNGIVSGVIVRECPPGEWLVKLANGKFVIVNERSFLDDQGNKMA